MRTASLVVVICGLVFAGAGLVLLKHLHVRQARQLGDHENRPSTPPPQRELVGSPSTIARPDLSVSDIASGRHRTNFDSLLRIARALDLKVVVGFESVAKGGRAREISSLSRWRALRAELLQLDFESGGFSAGAVGEFAAGLLEPFAGALLFVVVLARLAERLVLVGYVVLVSVLLDGVGGVVPSPAF